MQPLSRVWTQCFYMHLVTDCPGSLSLWLAGKGLDREVVRGLLCLSYWKLEHTNVVTLIRSTEENENVHFLSNEHEAEVYVLFLSGLGPPSSRSDSLAFFAVCKLRAVQPCIFH